MLSLRSSDEIAYDGSNNTCRMDLFADTAADLTGVTTFDSIVLLAGSSALDISTGDLYRMQSDGTWILQPGTGAFSNVYTKAEIDSMLLSYYTKAEADELFEWRTFTLEGIDSITFIAMGSPLTGWTVIGNEVQTGTPTPSDPITPEECGDLVETGEHAGEYAIPITVGGITQTIYLTEPLRKVGEYSDTVSYDGTVTRQIAKLVLTGNETGYQEWKKSYTYAGSFYAKLFMLMGTPKTIVCTHAEYTATINAQSYVYGKCAVDGTNPDRNLNLFIGESAWTVNDFRSYLASQYNNNTPVVVWFVLATTTTETVTAPTITPSAGENTLTVGTTLPPSEITITGQIRET